MRTCTQSSAYSCRKEDEIEKNANDHQSNGASIITIYINVYGLRQCYKFNLMIAQRKANGSAAAVQYKHVQMRLNCLLVTVIFVIIYMSARSNVWAALLASFCYDRLYGTQQHCFGRYRNDCVSSLLCALICLREGDRDGRGGGGGGGEGENEFDRF